MIDFSIFPKALKARFQYFLLFYQNKFLKKLDEMFLFQLKCSFRYQDIQIFVIFLFLVQLVDGSLKKYNNVHKKCWVQKQPKMFLNSSLNSLNFST